MPARMRAWNDGFSPTLHRLRFRTGTRKIYAKDRAFADTMQVHITVADVKMTRTDKNIHATYPQSATVAPILSRWIRVLPTHRGTTHNQGAADADGR
jgi:hypothetical protein